MAAPLAPAAPPWRITVASERLRSDDPWLRHKTTARARYGTARCLLPPRIDGILFLNERGEICEPSPTSSSILADRWSPRRSHPDCCPAFCGRGSSRPASAARRCCGCPIFAMPESGSVTRCVASSRPNGLPAAAEQSPADPPPPKRASEGSLPPRRRHSMMPILPLPPSAPAGSQASRRLGSARCCHPQQCGPESP
jgi:hypothetical protein